MTSYHERDAITNLHRAAAPSAYDEIYEEAQIIARKLGQNLAGRMDAMVEKVTYITFEDRKDAFADNLPCRIINAAKSKIG